MTKETQDKLFSLYIGKDDVREVMQSPWLDEKNGKVMASNGRHFLAISKEATVGEFPTRRMFASSIEGTRLGRISVAALKEALGKLPQEDEYITTYEGRDCEECEGTGMVTVEYRSKDGDEYDIECDCPICEGTGWKEQPRIEKTGRTIPAADATININGYYMAWNYIDTLCQACALVGVDSVDCFTSNITDLLTFRLTDNICVGIMRKTEPGSYTIKVEYYEQEN
jgi:hypothetical protein